MPKNISKSWKRIFFAFVVLMQKKFIEAELAKKIFNAMPEREFIERLAKLFEASVPAMTPHLNNLTNFCK